MKKAISIVLALAMVFVMSLSVFAMDRPTDSTDAEAWTEYYTWVIENSEDPTQIVTEILNDISEGALDPMTALSIIGTLAEQGLVENETVQEIITGIQDFLAGLGGEGDEGNGDDIGSLLPDFGDLELPEFDFSGISDSFSTIFDTVFGALGGIIDMIFGGGGNGDTPTTPGDDGDDGNLWGDDGDGGFGDFGSGDNSGLGDFGASNDFNNNSLGDTTVFAVAAVAAVAGVALVLTRKKSKEDDAE